MTGRNTAVVIGTSLALAITGWCAAQSDPDAVSSRVLIVDQAGEIYLLGDDCGFSPGLPQCPRCQFEQGHDFCSVGYKGGGMIYPSPEGNFFTVFRGIRDEGDASSLPVLHSTVFYDDCGEVIVVVDIHTCKALSIIKIDPDRSGKPDVRFTGSEDFLVVTYAGDGTTDYYRSPDFNERLALPFDAALLGALPGNRLLMTARFPGSDSDFYIVVSDDGDRFREITRHTYCEWGVSLRVGAQSEGGEWKGVFADDDGFVVLFPGNGNDTPQRVEAYRSTGRPPAVLELDPDAEGVEVFRTQAGLVCSWVVNGRPSQKVFVFPDADQPIDCDFCSHQETEATYWLNEEGKLIKLRDEKPCHFRSNPDGDRFDFLPYGRNRYLWTSPGGRYLVIPGALNPEQNPNRYFPVDRPGFFRKGYDSVLAVVDVEKCRIVRFINSPPHETQWMSVRFAPDGSLLLFSYSDRTVVYPAPSFEDSLSGTIPVELPGRPDRPIQMFKSRNGESIFLTWANVSDGYVLLRRHNAKVTFAIIPWDRMILPGQYPTNILLYADENVVGFLACNTTMEEEGKIPPTVIVIPYRTGEPRTILCLPHGAEDVAIVRDETGGLRCTYDDGKTKVSRSVLSPARTSDPGTPDEIPSEHDAPGHE